MSNTHIISQQPHLESTVECMRFNKQGAPTGFAYNMAGLVDDGEPPTIKFRQHEGTLDIEAVTAWATVACSPLQICHRTELRPELMSLFARGEGDNICNVLELLQMLGMDRVAEYYSRRGLHKHLELVGIPVNRGDTWVAVPRQDLGTLLNPPLDASAPSSTRHVG